MAAEKSHEFKRKESRTLNHKRIERLMSENGLASRTYKQYIHTTDSKHTESIADNIVDRKFKATVSNEKMISVTTVVSIEKGSIYIAGILNLYGMILVGLTIRKHNDKYLVREALGNMIYRGR